MQLKGAPQQTAMGGSCWVSHCPADLGTESAREIRAPECPLSWNRCPRLLLPVLEQCWLCLALPRELWMKAEPAAAAEADDTWALLWPGLCEHSLFSCTIPGVCLQHIIEGCELAES